MTGPGGARAFIEAHRVRWERQVRRARNKQRSASYAVRPPETRKCRHCGTRFTDPGTGQLRHYCSPICRKRYHHTRSTSARKASQKRSLAERDGAACCYCRTGFAADLSDATLEHVLSFAEHKTNNLAGLRLACEPCNTMSGWLVKWKVTGQGPGSLEAQADAVLEAYTGVLCTLSQSWQVLPLGGRGPAAGLRWARLRGLAERHPDDGRWKLTIAGAAVRNEVASKGYGMLAGLPIRTVGELTAALKSL
ncbi:MAG TPA: hypothetical protein VFQ44_06815 [Streptosporangiaceae bacterium]|nr:hypothetical protein [Streptosporangiaceae bacterium]